MTFFCYFYNNFFQIFPQTWPIVDAWYRKCSTIPNENLKSVFLLKEVFIVHFTNAKASSKKKTVYTSTSKHLVPPLLVSFYCSISFFPHFRVTQADNHITGRLWGSTVLKHNFLSLTCKPESVSKIKKYSAGQKIKIWIHFKTNKSKFFSCIITATLKVNLK